MVLRNSMEKTTTASTKRTARQRAIHGLMQMMDSSAADELLANIRWSLVSHEVLKNLLANCHKLPSSKTGLQRSFLPHWHADLRWLLRCVIHWWGKVLRAEFVRAHVWASPTGAFVCWVGAFGSHGGFGGRLCTSKVARLCTSDGWSSVHVFVLFFCYMVPFGGAAFVFSHWSSPKFFHTTHISQLTQLIQYNSTLLTSYRTRLTPLHSSHNSQKSFHITALISQLTQLVSAHKSHNSSHTTHLTQVISHNSSYTTQLTQELLSRAIWWSCFRVLSLKFTQVLSHNSHLTTHTTHPIQLHSSHKLQNSSHTTPLISQLTEVLSHHCAHLTTHTTRLISQVTQLISHNSSYTSHLSQLVLHNSTYSRAAFACHLVELLSCSLIEVHPSSFTQLTSHNSHNSSSTTLLFSQVTELVSHHSTHLTTHRSPFTSLRSSHNSHNSSHLTSHTTHLTQLILHKSSLTTRLTQLNLLKSCFRVPFGGAAFVFSHWSSPKFFHTTHISQLTQLIQYNSTLLTSYRTRLTPLHSSHNSQKSFHITALISQLTQLVSSHKSHNSSHTTHLTQVISHNSSYTTQLTQELLSRAIWWSCFRVLSLKFTQVLSHNSHLTTHTTHPVQLYSSHKLQNSSHTTPLISQLTEVLSHHCAHLTTHTTRLISQVTQLISHNSSYTSHLSQLVLHNSTYSRAAFACHLVELLSCSLIEVHPSSFTQLTSHNSHNSSNTTPLFSQVTELVSHHSTHLTTHRSPFTSLRSSHNSHNSSHLTSHTTHLTQLIIGTWTLSSHPTPPHPPTPPTHPTPPQWNMKERGLSCWKLLVPRSNVRGWTPFVRGWAGLLCADESFAMCADESLSMCADESLTARVGIPGDSGGGSQGDGIHMVIGKTEDGFSGISHQRDLSKREHREHRSQWRSSEGHRPTGEDLGWIKFSHWSHWCLGQMNDEGTQVHIKNQSVSWRCWMTVCLQDISVCKDTVISDQWSSSSRCRDRMQWSKWKCCRLGSSYSCLVFGMFLDVFQIQLDRWCGETMQWSVSNDHRQFCEELWMFNPWSQIRSLQTL